MSQTTYGCTALAGTNKAGLLKPDADGYYSVVLGALGVYNSAGAFYSDNCIKDVFKASSSLMRRIANGACRGEYGHPKRLPGQPMREFIDRVMQIYESEVCCHFKEVTVDYTAVKDSSGRPVIAILGKAKPSGPKGAALKASFDNPNENVCFSVRSFTDDTRNNGVVTKDIKSIVTWDYVNEPGIAVANKFSSPALESMAEVLFTQGQLNAVSELQASSPFGMESGGVSAAELITDLGWSAKPAKQLPSSRW